MLMGILHDQGKGIYQHSFPVTSGQRPIVCQQLLCAAEGLGLISFTACHCQNKAAHSRDIRVEDYAYRRPASGPLHQ